MTYPLDMFLGEGFKFPHGMPLYQITLYLSPGMYHRIHSPIDWTVLGRRCVIILDTFVLGMCFANACVRVQ